jgi:adenine phosphoribosyltransferase
MTEKLKSAIRDVPDFPKAGILFKDITTLCKDAASFQRMVDMLAHDTSARAWSLSWVSRRAVS